MSLILGCIIINYFITIIVSYYFHEKILLSFIKCNTVLSSNSFNVCYFYCNSSANSKIGDFVKNSTHQNNLLFILIIQKTFIYCIIFIYNRILNLTIIFLFWMWAKDRVGTYVNYITIDLICEMCLVMLCNFLTRPVLFWMPNLMQFVVVSFIQ